jgi:hypothetical protein
VLLWDSFCFFIGLNAALVAQQPNWLSQNRQPVDKGQCRNDACQLQVCSAFSSSTHPTVFPTTPVLYDFGDLRARPAGKFVSSGEANDYSELNGLGDVRTAFELAGFVEYYLVDWFRSRAELREGVVGHHGRVADFSGDLTVPVVQRLTFSVGPRFT